MSKVIRAALRELKNKIKETPHSRLDALRDSICISDIHPQIKEACLKDIDYKQNSMVYANEAVAVDGEITMGEI